MRFQAQTLFMAALGFLGILVIVSGTALAGEIHDAARSGDVILIKKQLEEGSPIDQRDEKGRTALHLAAYNGHAETIHFLISNDADVNAQANGFFQATPLHMAAERQQTPSVKILIEAGADIEAKTDLGFTPLLLAASVGHLETIALLLAQKADPNVKALHGETPILRAMIDDKVHILEFLATHGARIHDPINLDNVNSSWSKGFSLLHGAAMQGYVNSLRFLINQGMNVNILSERGRTPLHYASKENQSESTQLLLDNGADQSIRDVTGKTALDYAKEHHSQNIISILERSNQREGVD